MKHLSQRLSGRLLVALLAGLIACDGNNVIGPSNQLEVTNATDDFQFQVSNLRNVTQTLTYNWSNTGDSANVNQASAVTAGTATLTIRGPGGSILYQASLQNNGTFHTQLGTVGTWRIEVALVDADGTVNFRVQRAP